MAENILNLTNGEFDEKGMLRLLGALLTQSGVVQADSMKVEAQGTPDMTVLVNGAATGHDIVFRTSAGDTYHGWNTADKNVTISANATGVTKKDAIVAYADLTAGIGTSNNPGALKFIAIRGSGTNTAPDDTQIRAGTVGATNPYVVLAHVSVSNGASSVNSGNITDQRPLAQVAKAGIEPLGTAQYGDGTVTIAKIDKTSWTDVARASDTGNASDAAAFKTRVVGGIAYVSGTIVKASAATEHWYTGSNALPSNIRPAQDIQIRPAIVSGSIAPNRLVITTAGVMTLYATAATGTVAIALSYPVS